MTSSPSRLHVRFDSLAIGMGVADEIRDRHLFGSGPVGERRRDNGSSTSCIDVEVVHLAVDERRQGEAHCLKGHS